MVEIRKAITKNEWSIIAPSRSARPYDFSSDSGERDEPEVDENCPFCPGNESETPAEVYAVRDGGPADDSTWKVRVFPNKYPALDSDGTSSVIESDLYPTRGGYGHHEVIAETPVHNTSLSELETEKVELIVRTYVDRARELREKPDIDYVSLFKNHGGDAGASLSHPHSQIMATAFVPDLLRQEYGVSRDYHQNHGECLYCRLIESERDSGDRVVLEDDDFLAFCPFGSRFPYETHLLPKRHRDEFTKISDQEISGLARALKGILSGLKSELGDFPYNYAIHTAPAKPERGREDETPPGKYYHWHLEIMPRLATPAGFEWGSGNFINLTRPEDAAKLLKEALG